MMKKKIALAISTFAFLALCNQAKATNVALADWCVNNSGDVASACNGAGSGGGGISLASFDTTLVAGCQPRRYNRRLSNGHSNGKLRGVLRRL